MGNTLGGRVRDEGAAGLIIHKVGGEDRSGRLASTRLIPSDSNTNSWPTQTRSPASYLQGEREKLLFLSISERSSTLIILWEILLGASSV